MKKSTKLNLIFCAFAFVLMLIYLFGVGETEDLLKAFANIRIGYLFIALGLIVLYWMCEALCNQIVLNKVCPGQKYRHTLSTTIIGQYFNCITPFASGGQPMQGYYMTFHGVPGSAAVSVLMSRLILYHITETIYCLVVLILRFSFFTKELGGLMALTIVGFLTCVAVIVFLILVSFCKNWTMSVLRKCIFLLHKIHLIKDPEKTCNNLEESMNASFNNMKFIVKEPVMILKTMLVTAAQLTVYFTISYVIYRGFGLSGVDYLTVISCQAFVYLISAFMPMPGAMGAAEGSYVGFFSHVYGNGSPLVAISTFIWRFLTFYLPIVVGMILTLVLQRKKNKKEPQDIDRQESEPLP